MTVIKDKASDISAPPDARQHLQAKPFALAQAPDRVRWLAGYAIGWPFLDPLIQWVLKRRFFPLSRLWATAHLADGDPKTFWQRLELRQPTNPQTKLARKLAQFEVRRAAARATDAAWEKSFFPPSPPRGKDEPACVRSSQNHLAAIEAARAKNSHAYYAARFGFGFLLRHKIPRVAYATPSQETFEKQYGALLTNPAPFFAAPSRMPLIKMSRPLETDLGRDFWLQFKSPEPPHEKNGASAPNSAKDTVFARVHEPAGIKNPPTLIYGHGVCVEFDQWQGLIDEVDALVRRGIRVIRPEAPFHGRRTRPGTYGGEPLVASFPLGSMDLFTHAVREWAVLSDWARNTSTGPLALGGSSLGALTAQLVAEKSAMWRANLQPDALFLVTHCGEMKDVVLQGQIIGMWGDEKAIANSDWADDLAQEHLMHYLDLLSPKNPLPIAPGRIVSVLGTRDKITPFAGGLRLLDNWQIPPSNRFIWNRGHFSVPATLMRNPAPLDRFCEVLQEISKYDGPSHRG